MWCGVFRSAIWALVFVVAAMMVIVPPPEAAASIGDFFKSDSSEEDKKASTHSAPATTPTSPEEDGAVYGVDVSFPMHHWGVSKNYPWLAHNVNPDSEPVPKVFEGMVPQPLGDRQAFYDDFLNGCKEHYGRDGGRCKQTELDRVSMSLRQPASMQNYTDMGFHKIRAPEKVFALIKEFWEKNHDQWRSEKWPKGNTYTNHWKAPTYMVSVEDTSLRGGGGHLKQAVWNAARETIQEWTGQELKQCSLYGIRVYTEGAVLATHVDRLPLVSSAIINVAQDVDEPWPLEVISHDGRAYNVTMSPGDMVLYESHSVLHGRPFPLKGRFYANVFIHFEPIGHTLRHYGGHEEDDTHVDLKYRRAMEQGTGGHEAVDHEDGLPPYIVRGTEEADRWIRSHPTGKRSAVSSFATGSTNAHEAARDGDIKALEKHLKKGKHVANAKDENGWTPLHEAARSGHVAAVELLIKHGSKVNELTQDGRGESALWWATKHHGKDSAIARYLESVGGLVLGPDL